ncbi:MAG: hypothetical protein K9G76_08835 [Bacteroidales bacterium]|nr:hypothetical protein [Bacteroidales bacterium]MCF8404471.1 hypothetical protein [Bacteroidales bacterium]
MIIKKFISPTPQPVKISETGSDALYYMDENRLENIAVVDKSVLLGSITEADVFALADPDKPLAESKLSLKKDFVYEHQHIYEAINVMASSGLNLLPVVNEQENYVGNIRFNDLKDLIAEFLSVRNPGAIIVLEVNQKDYILSQIAQIMESQDSKILSLSIFPDPDSTMMDITIKINTLEIQAIVQTFNRYNYIIKATYTEDEKMYDDLRSRYDLLMKYLSI